MAGLPREIIKWLQSLDLSFPIKNPKRDFCNGYLIAEIFSRYYPNEIQIWSFYTGSSRPQKENNWFVLNKFFKKNHVYIPMEAMEAVMDCHTGAANLFIENIYMLLTQHKLPDHHYEAKVQAEEIVPHFALPTTSCVIRNMAESPVKAKKVVEAHKEFLKSFKVIQQEPVLKKTMVKKAMIEPAIVPIHQEIKVKQLV